ncbi:MAG: AAA family ATPase [Rhodospirillales bacterium]|nr:AAA family ATPase [Rhodospirillales bacterium]
MRFQELHLKCYGPFSDRVLAFAPGEHDFHAIYGRNEAGKTTTLRALSNFLFGFEDRRKDAVGDDFLHEKRALRIGAVIRATSGQVLTLYRRKGRTGTLLDADDRAVDDGALEPVLGTMHRELFHRLFGLDHVRLRAGGEDILQGGGEVGLTLFEASAGLVGLRGVLDDLCRDADAIFRPRGQTQSLNQALSRYREARTRIRDATLSEETWHQAAEACRQLEADQNDLGHQLDDRQKARTRLERIRRNLRDLVVRRSIESTLAELAAVPELRDGFGAERLAAQERLVVAERDAVRAREAADRIKAELGVVAVPEALLDQAQDIEALQEERGRVRGALIDLPKCQIEFAAVEARISERLREADLRLTAEDAAAALPTRPALARLRALIKNHDALTTDLARVRSAAREADEAVRAANEALAKLDGAPDPAPLRAAVEGVGEQGRLEDALSDAEAGVARMTAELGDRLAALPLWSSAAEELVRFPAPADKTVDRFDADLADADVALSAARAAVAAVHDTIAELERNKSALVAQGRIPTATSVAEARTRRDNGWRLIRRAFIDASGDVAAEAAAFDAQRALPEAYERSVAEVDALTDALYNEAERVARFQELDAAHRRALEQLATAQELQAAAADRRGALERAWRDLWAALGREPLPPAEMGVWLRHRADIVTMIGAVRNQRDQINALQRRIGEARRVLIDALLPFGETASAPGETVVALLRRGKATLAAIMELRAERLRLNDRRDEAERTRDRERQRLARVETALTEWQAEWGRAVGVLARPQDATTEEVEAVLEIVDDLRTLLVSWSDLRHQRIEAMQDHIAGFERRVGAVALAAAPDLRDEPAVDAVRHLCERLKHARNEHHRRQQLQADLAREHAALRAAETAAGEATAALERLCREAGRDRPEDLDHVERQALHKAQKLRDLEEIEARLLEHNPACDLQQIEAEAASEDSDSLPGRSEALDQEIAELSTRRSELARRIGEISNQLQGMDGGDAAARAAQDAEAQLARIREDAERCITYRVAIALLTRAVAAYRESHQGPLLAHAGALFGSLTCRSFEGLATDLDDRDQPVLLGIRPGGASLTVDAMSDGTRDQLYLAIRLAAIEAYLAHNEPMPLVLDDILINFDDARAAATLRVLYDLSRRTQVLLFTHHTHLIDLARAAIGEQRISVLTLDS